MKKRQRLLILRIFLWTICIYHISLGCLPFLPGKMAVKAALLFFGLDIISSGQMEYMCKLFGMYTAIFGVFMGAMAIDPEKYRPLIRLSVLLFAIRFVNNIIMLREMQAAFQVPLIRLLQCLFFLGLMGIALLVLTPAEGDR